MGGAEHLLGRELMDEVGTRPSDPEYVADLEGKYAALSIAHVRLMYYYRRLEQRAAQSELELALYRESTQPVSGPDEWSSGPS